MINVIKRYLTIFNRIPMLWHRWILHMYNLLLINSNSRAHNFCGKSLVVVHISRCNLILKRVCYAIFFRLSKYRSLKLVASKTIVSLKLRKKRWLLTYVGLRNMISTVDCSAFAFLVFNIRNITPLLSCAG